VILPGASWVGRSEWFLCMANLWQLLGVAVTLASVRLATRKPPKRYQITRLTPPSITIVCPVT
jgi:hypothetical protein